MSRGCILRKVLKMREAHRREKREREKTRTDTCTNTNTGATKRIVRHLRVIISIDTTSVLIYIDVKRANRKKEYCLWIA